MIDGTTLLMFIQFLFSFLLMFMLVPMLAIRYEKQTPFFERMFIALIHSMIFFILAVYLLVSLKLFETFSIIAVSLGGLIYFWRKKNAAILRSPGTKTLVQIYNISENVAALRQACRNGAVRAWSRIKASAAAVARNTVAYPLTTISIAVVIGYGAYVRFRHVLTHYYFGASDVYVHIEWAKYLEKNIVFIDGVYTYGLEAVIAAMCRFFMIDMYNITRFIGALGSTLIVVSIVFAMRQFGKNRAGLLAALIVFVLYARIPGDIWRQISALPMEFAAIFFLPGMALWTRFCREGSRRHLLLAAECLLLTVLIHPFAAECLGFGYVIVGIIYLPQVWKRKQFIRAIVTLATAGTVGLLPLLVGLASGVPFQGASIGYIQSNVGKVATTNSISLSDLIAKWATTEHLAFAGGITIVLLVLLGLSVWQRSRKKEVTVGIPGLLLTVFVFLLFYNSDKFGLPRLLPPDRLALFFGLMLAFVCGLIVVWIGKILDRSQDKPLISSFVVLMLSFYILWAGPVIKAPAGAQYQYDDAVKTYISIRDHFDAGDWTIVSPVEEYPLVEAYGYHTNLWEFVQRNATEGQDPMGFPTSNVFFFVEKVPLVSGGPLVPDEAMKPFPGPVDGDLSGFYYHSPNRRILEAKMYSWAEWFMRMHPDKMTVYYETPNMKVFHLKQVAKVPPTILPVLPNNEEGKW